jgi:hypothetical protein
MASVTKARSRAIPSVEPSLGWTYLSRDALARAKAQMDEETLGVRDEVGFLTIHQGYADLFFPGTSVLHTRARYLLFVPWLFEDLAPATGALAQRALKEKERILAGRLRNQPGQDHPDRRGTIGALKFPKPSAQPPSTVYWNALATWGILRPGSNARTISRAQAHRLLSMEKAATDDDGHPLIGFEPPFVKMPKRPANWLDGEISLRMERSEADFLREHVVRVRPRNRPELSLIAQLARLRTVPPVEMFDDAVLAVAGDDRSALLRAQQAACLSGIGRAIYDALLERIVVEQDGREGSTRHRQHLDDMVRDYGDRAVRLDLAGLQTDIGIIPARLLSVLEATTAWLAQGGGDPSSLYDVFQTAEARKGPRARLSRTPNGRERRAEWATDEHVLSDVLHYRWRQVRTLLADMAEAV